MIQRLTCNSCKLYINVKCQNLRVGKKNRAPPPGPCEARIVSPVAPGARKRVRTPDSRPEARGTARRILRPPSCHLGVFTSAFPLTSVKGLIRKSIVKSRTQNKTTTGTAHKSVLYLCGSITMRVRRRSRGGWG